MGRNPQPCSPSEANDTFPSRGLWPSVGEPARQAGGRPALSLFPRWQTLAHVSPRGQQQHPRHPSHISLFQAVLGAQPEAPFRAKEAVLGLSDPLDLGRVSPLGWPEPQLAWLVLLWSPPPQTDVPPQGSCPLA